MHPFLFALVTLTAYAQVDVLTSHYDAQRTGANLRETMLDTANVTPAKFGKLFTVNLDGQIYAQPLVVSRLTMPVAGTIDVVFVATMHNSVYAINTVDGAILWTTSLGQSVLASDYGCRDIQNEVGILSTPVIDRAAQTLFAVANTIDAGGVYHYSLHALDLITGTEILGGPVEITAPGFDPLMQWQRPGLLLDSGIVYVAFGSHCDVEPFNGWITGYAAQTGLPQSASFLTTGAGLGASVWQSGRGIASDGNGKLFAVTGNGDFDGSSNFGETVLALWPDLGVADWFVPDGWSVLNENDRDLGTSGAALIPNSNFLVTGTKDGRLFVLNRDALGNFAPGDTQIPQEFPAIGFGIFTFATWPRSNDTLVYVQGNNDVVKAFSLGANGFAATPLSIGSLKNGIPYQGMAISADGSDPSSAILWTSTPDDALHAYSAANLSQELWNSYMMDDRDTLGSFAKFVPPTVANGRVFVPNFINQLVVYGLFRPQKSATQPVPEPSRQRP